MIALMMSFFIIFQLRFGLLILSTLLNLGCVSQVGGVLEDDAAGHTTHTLVRTAVDGGLRLEEYAYSLQGFRDGEILHAGNTLRGDADLEGAEAVDVDALGSLQGIGDDLHHLGEDGLGVGLLGG